MPTFIVSGSKEMKDGNLHTIAEIARSETKADWTAAHYREAGYAVTITAITEGEIR